MFIPCAKRCILRGIHVQKGGSSVVYVCKMDPQWWSKELCWSLSYLAVNHCKGDLQQMHVSQLTIQHSVVAVMDCQLSACVMYSLCNLLGNQLVFLTIETNLYLWFKMVSSRNTVQFLNKIYWIHECQHGKLVQSIYPSIQAYFYIF